MEDRNLSAAGGPESAGAEALSVEKTERLTYEDVVAFAKLKSVGDVAGQVRNRASSLTGFLTHHGLDLQSKVGHVLASDFDEAVASYLHRRRAAGLKESSLANQRTHLKWWASTLAEMLELQAQPRFSAFHEAFEFYFQAAKKTTPKITQLGLARLCGKHDDYFGVAKEKKTKTVLLTGDVVQRLENALGAPPTSLTRFMATTRDGLVERQRHAPQTVYGKLISSLTRDPYMLKEIPPRLRQEVQDFIRFKTSISPALKRNMRWILRSNSSCRKGAWLDILSLDGKNYAPSACKFLSHILRFFGALAKLGYDPTDFSIVWLCEPDLMSEYLEFSKSRTGNITKGHIPTLVDGRGLLYDQGGWIYQQPKFGALLREKVELDEEGWKLWCNARHAKLTEQGDNLEKDGLIRVGRDVKEPIKDILDRDHPLDAIFEMVESMEGYLKKFEWQPTSLNMIDKSAFERDITILKIISVQPLRMRMFEEMTYRADNSGNLYKRKTGEWAIRFKPEDFKNERGAAKDTVYDVPLPMALNASIEHYLDDVRPKFTAAGELVFVPSHKGGPKGAIRADRKHGTEWLTRTISKRGKQFLRGCPGFGPHALRHIVATDYIKNNPGDYLTAAQILHDKLETVMREYAHLKAEDGHKRYQLYHGKLMESWRKRA